MNLSVFIQGIIEIILSLFTGLLIFFLSFTFFSLLTKNIDKNEELKKNNIAIAIFISAFVFGIMLIVKNAISPSLDTIKIVFESDKFQSILIMLTILRIVIYYILAGIGSFVFIFISVKIFLVTQRKLSIDLLVKSNISFSLFAASFILSLSILLIDPFVTILASISSRPDISFLTNHDFITMPVLIEGVIKLIIVIIMVIVVYFFSFIAFDKLTKNIDENEEIKNNNIAVSVLISSFIFGIMIIIKAVSVNIFQLIANFMESDFSFVGLAGITGIVLLFLLFTAVISFLLNWASIKIFMIFTTKIDDMDEIKANNAAIALIIGVFVISMALIMENGISLLFSSFVSFPQTGRGLLNL